MASAQSTGRAGLPLVAALLTWFVPGLGLLYLGRALAGLLTFALIEGLFLIGALLARGASFDMLDPDLRSSAAFALAPELGNLGGFLWQFGSYADPTRALLPRLFSSSEKLGVLLMALSGLANLAAISGAHFEARRQAASRQRSLAAGPSPALLAALQGLLPGLYALGLVLCEAACLERERHYYYWSAQLLTGLPALLALPFGGPLEQAIPRQDLGVFYAGLAGLLNLLTCLDVYGFQAARLLGQDPTPAPKPAPGPAAPAANPKHLVGMPGQGGPA